MPPPTSANASCRAVHAQQHSNSSGAAWCGFLRTPTPTLFGGLPPSRTAGWGRAGARLMLDKRRWLTNVRLATCAQRACWRQV
eukprot:15364031-Alexandrium_andersonii.AAC.1